MKTASPDESDLRAERIRNSDLQFFCVPTCWGIRRHTCTTKKRGPRDTLFKNHELNLVPEMSLRYLQNMSIYCSLGNLQFVPF